MTCLFFSFDKIDTKMENCNRKLDTVAHKSSGKRKHTHTDWSDCSLCSALTSAVITGPFAAHFLTAHTSITDLHGEKVRACLSELLLQVATAHTPKCTCNQPKGCLLELLCLQNLQLLYSWINNFHSSMQGFDTIFLGWETLVKYVFMMINFQNPVYYYIAS